MRGKAVVAGNPGCLAGDTMLHVRYAGYRYPVPVSIRTLYKCWVGRSSTLYPDLGQQPVAYVESRNAVGDIYYNRVLDVVHAGRKYCITLHMANGAFITCTTDHPIMQGDGSFTHAGDLELGDDVIHVLRRGGVTHATASRIVKLVEAGTRDTYDLRMEAPDHNFVASGFVVHNSGKTATLIGLIARLVADGIDPRRILAMTFTKNAATEMEKRLEACGVTDARVGTIHSVAYQIIREYAGFKENIDDKGRLFIELEKTLGSMRRCKELPKWAEESGPFREYIAYCKSRGAVLLHDDRFGANRVLESVAMKLADAYIDALPGGRLRQQHLLEVYTQFEKRRHEAGLMDFDDMLAWSWLLLVREEQIRYRWQQAYDYVIVDESQDSNPIQWDLARFFAAMDSCMLGKTIETPDSWYIERIECGKSLISFGDIAQSIYKFRGAEPDLLLAMAREKDVDVLSLSLNYRSTPGICEAGSMLVAGKPWNLAGAIVADGAQKALLPSETWPEVRGYASPEAEAEAILTWVQSRTGEGGAEALNDHVVMSRTSLGLQHVELECLRRRVPYRKRASACLFDTREVKDLLGYLRVACCLDPDGSAMRRIINSPFRYVSTRFIEECVGATQYNGRSLLDTLLEQSDTLHFMQRKSLRDLGYLLRRLNKIAVLSVDETADEKRRRGPADMIGEVLNGTAFLDDVRARQGMTDETSKVELLYEIQRIAEMFRSPVEFLNYIDQLAVAVRASGAAKIKVGDKSAKDALTLSTIHAMKGLEHKRVWVAGVVPGRHPHAMATDMDEELRLMYVAVTRAKTECVVSYYPGRVAGLSPYVTKLLVLRGEKPEEIVDAG